MSSVQVLSLSLSSPFSARRAGRFIERSLHTLFLSARAHTIPSPSFPGAQTHQSILFAFRRANQSFFFVSRRANTNQSFLFASRRANQSIFFVLGAQAQSRVLCPEEVTHVRTSQGGRGPRPRAFSSWPVLTTRYDAAANLDRKSVV